MSKESKIAKYESLIREQKQIVASLDEVHTKSSEQLDEAKSKLRDYEVDLQILKDNNIISNLKPGVCYYKSYKYRKTFSWDETKEILMFVIKSGKNTITVKSIYRYACGECSKFSDYRSDCYKIYNDFNISKKHFIDDLLDYGVEIISQEDAVALAHKWLGV